MKGYAFLDADARLQFRNKEYIDNDNPHFWQQNKYDILHKWYFDTDDVESMYFMLRQIRDIFRASKLSQQTVRDFYTMINYDTSILKSRLKDDKDASKV